MKEKKAVFKIGKSKNAFKLLSKNIYTLPSFSTFKELLSNAIDAHTKAGREDEYVDIKIKSLYDGQDNHHKKEREYVFLSIGDKGNGMTLKEIDDVYTTYFKSDKSDDEHQIGGFGLGAKSPFSVTEKFTVITKKNGKQHVILCEFKQHAPSWRVLSENPVLPDDTGSIVNLFFEKKEQSDELLTQSLNKTLSRLAQWEKECGDDTERAYNRYPPYYFSFLWSVPANLTINGKPLPDYERRKKIVHLSDALVKCEAFSEKPFFFLNGMPVMIKDETKKFIFEDEDRVVEQIVGHVFLLSTVFRHISLYGSITPFLKSKEIPLTPSREYVYFNKDFTQNDLNALVGKAILSSLELTADDIWNIFIFMLKVSKKGTFDLNKSPLALFDDIIQGIENGQIPQGISTILKPELRGRFELIFKVLASVLGDMELERKQRLMERCGIKGEIDGQNLSTILNLNTILNLSTILFVLFRPLYILSEMYKRRNLFNHDTSFLYTKHISPEIEYALSHVSAKRLDEFMGVIYSRGNKKNLRNLSRCAHTELEDNFIFLEGYRPKRGTFVKKTSGMGYNDILICSHFNHEEINNFIKLYGGRFVEKAFLESPVKIKIPEQDLTDKVYLLEYDEQGKADLLLKSKDELNFSSNAHIVFLPICADKIPKSHLSLPGEMASYFKRNDIHVIMSNSMASSYERQKLAQHVEKHYRNVYHAGNFINGKQIKTLNTKFSIIVTDALLSGLFHERIPFPEDVFKIGLFFHITGIENEMYDIPNYMETVCDRIIDNPFIKETLKVFFAIKDESIRKRVKLNIELFSHAVKRIKDVKMLLWKTDNRAFAQVLSYDKRLIKQYCEEFEKFLSRGDYPDKEKVYVQMIKDTSKSDALNAFIEAYLAYYDKLLKEQQVVF